MLESAEKLLLESGWVPGRSRSPGQDVATLEENGFPVGGRVNEFLREYGGLVVKYFRNGREDRVEFDVNEACAQVDPDWVVEYSMRAGVPLSPVGFANHGHLLLLLGQDGRFFGGFDDFFGYLGSSPREMISRLVMQQIETRF
jgi:SUKH-3 immunity protein